MTAINLRPPLTQSPGSLCQLAPLTAPYNFTTSGIIIIVLICRKNWSWDNIDNCDQMIRWSDDCLSLSGRLKNGILNWHWIWFNWIYNNWIISNWILRLTIISGGILHWHWIGFSSWLRFTPLDCTLLNWHFWIRLNFHRWSSFKWNSKLNVQSKTWGSFKVEVGSCTLI